MEQTIVLFHGELNTLNAFTDQMRKGFEELGYNIFMFDLTTSVQSLGKLYALLQEKSIVAMLGFNCAFFGLSTASGTKVWEQMRIPCINILVDHPYWYKEILLGMPSNSVALCVDRNHMKYVERFYPHIEINGFIAHGGTPMSTPPKLLKERPMDVLYAGSLYTQYVEIQKPDFSQWSFPAEKICCETIELLKTDKHITIENALDKCMSRNNIVLSENDLCDFISSCVFIERVVSSHFREKIIRTVAESGISLTICGDGWEKCEWISLPNVHYEGMVSPEEVLTKMENSKIVLNTFPWFKDGSHERVFNGMLRGCVIVSESSEYLNEILPQDMWYGFDLTDMAIATLPKKIKELLLDDKTMQYMSEAGRQLASENHTWQMRAREIHEDILVYL